MKIILKILAIIIFCYAIYLFLLQFKLHESEPKLKIKYTIIFAISMTLFAVSFFV